MLFDALNEQAIKKAKQTGLPYFLISEKEQKGDTFAERYTNALQTIFKKGFEHVISIGNDTPQLCSQHILDAAQAMQSNKAVIGPSKDGGFYLLGIHKSFFNRKLFLQFPWQQAHLLDSILEAISLNNIESIQLPTLQDIDTLKDVNRLKDAFHISSSIKFILWQIVALNRTQTTYQKTYHTNPFLVQLHNKGSPLAA